MKRPKHKYLLLVLDGIVVNYSFLLAMELHTPARFHPVRAGFPYIAPEILFFLAYSLAILFIFYTNRLYKIDTYLSVTVQLQRMLKCLAYAVSGIAVISFFTKSPAIVDSRLVILIFFLSCFLLLIAVRILLFRPLFKICSGRGLGGRKTLIIGAGDAGKRLGSTLSKRNSLGLRLVGFLDDRMPVGSQPIDGIAVLGRVADVARIVRSHRIREAVLCLEGVTEERYLEAIDLCAHTRARVLVGSTQFDVIPRYIYQEHYGGVPVFGVMNSRAYLGSPALKRILDLVLALPMLLLFLPFFLIVAAAIRLDSPGPVFFKQKRIGRNGVPFTFYKFRSMCKGSDCDKLREDRLQRFIRNDDHEMSGSTKIVDDRKVTRVGRFLRKTSIDELPQLFNVVKGDMSLVGPRPCLPYEWDSYASWHRKRLSVTPGCTGVWQVFARSQVGFRDMVILDLFYVYNVSFPLDLLLILKTVPVMLFGSGGR